MIHPRQQRRPPTLLLSPNHAPIDVMSGPIQSTLTFELRRDAILLDHACRRTLGISGTMFRAFKFLFYITAIVFVVYLMEFQGVDWTIAVAVSILFISGPEGVETYLINQGIVDAPERED